MKTLIDTPTPIYQLRDTDAVIGENMHTYVLKVRDLPLGDKPRERLLKGGPETLSVAELLAILLGVGTRKEEVMVMAQRILKEYGERTIINETNPSRLAETLQIPIVKACQIVASFELGRRFYQERTGKPVFISSPEQAYEYLDGMRHMKKEQLKGLYLNNRYQLIHEEVISVGSLSANIVHPREVFQPAIEHSAAAVIIAHNHPSNVLDPTDADLEVTEQLVEAGKIMGIDLIDHLIVGSDTFRSIIGRIGG